MPEEFDTAEETASPAPIIMEGPQGPRVEPQPIPWWLQEQYTAQRERQNREQVQNEVMRIMQTVPVRSADDATAAIQMAMRLEGALGYQADVASGEDPSRAIAKWGPKLYFQHPQAMAPAIQRLKPVGMPSVLDLPGMPKAFLSPTGRITVPPASTMQGAVTPPPTKGETVYDSQGGKVGTRFQLGPNRYTIQYDKPTTQVTTFRIQDIDRKLMPLRKQLAKLREESSDIIPEVAPDMYREKARAALQVQREIQMLEDQRNSLLPAAGQEMSPQTIETGFEEEEAEAPSHPMPLAAPEKKPVHLTKEQATAFLRQAKGDKAKARQLARDAGFTF